MTVSPTANTACRYDEMQKNLGNTPLSVLEESMF